MMTGDDDGRRTAVDYHVGWSRWSRKTHVIHPQSPQAISQQWSTVQRPTTTSHCQHPVDHSTIVGVICDETKQAETRKPADG
jgi:hypothetical protein